MQTPPLARILALALVVRVAVPLGAFAVHGSPQWFTTADSDTYLQPALALAGDGRFTGRDGAPETQRTPGYPLLIAVGALAGHPTLVTIGLQIVLGVGTVWAVALLARRLAPDSPHLARWSATIYALDPLSVVYPSLLLTETLFAALFAAHLLALLSFLRAPDGIARPAAAGLLAAACTFVRPIACFWPLAAAAFAAWRLRRRGARACAVFLVAAVLPCALWATRNAALSGYRGFSTSGAETLYLYHAAGVMARNGGLTFEDARAALRARAAAIAGDAARAGYMRREGSRIVLEHPAIFLGAYLSGIARLLGGPGFTEYMQLYGQSVPGGLTRAIAEGSWRERPWLSIGAAAFLPIVLAQLAGALIGATRVRRLAAGWLLLGSAAYFVLLSGGPVAHSRFRHPAMPMLCVLAAAGIVRPGDGASGRPASDRGIAGGSKLRSVNRGRQPAPRPAPADGGVGRRPPGPDVRPPHARSGGRLGGPPAPFGAGSTRGLATGGRSSA